LRGWWKDKKIDGRQSVFLHSGAVEELAAWFLLCLLLSSLIGLVLPYEVEYRLERFSELLRWGLSGALVGVLQSRIDRNPNLESFEKGRPIGRILSSDIARILDNLSNLGIPMNFEVKASSIFYHCTVLLAGVTKPMWKNHFSTIQADRHLKTLCVDGRFAQTMVAA
jgi:hypothetical protein